MNKNTNILFVLGVYPSIGGVESVVTNLSNDFTDLGMNVHIASFESNCSLEVMNLHSKVKILRLSKPVYSKSNRTLLSRYVKDYHVDFVINDWVLPFYVSMLIKKSIKGTKCKFIQAHQNLPTTNARLKDLEIKMEETNGIHFFDKLRWQAVNLVSRLSLKYVCNVCDKFVLLSPTFISQFARYIWTTDISKMYAIPETFDSTANGTLPKKNKEVLYLGRLDYNQKRVRRVIDIWSELEKKYPDWFLTIVGDGPDMKELKRRTNEYGLQRVSFEGFQKGDKYFSRAAIMLLVSEYEGFGIVLAEAQSHACVPVALDSYTALHDIVENEKNGIILNYPYDKKMFVKAVEGLMLNEERREKMAVNGMETVKRFERPKVVNMWIELFNSLNYNKSVGGGNLNSDITDKCRVHASPSYMERRAA